MHASQTGCWSRIAEISREIGEILSVVRHQESIRIGHRRPFRLLDLSLLDFSMIKVKVVALVIALVHITLSLPCEAQKRQKIDAV